MEMKDLCANFTTDLIASTAFGLRVNSVHDPNATFRHYGRKIFDYNVFRGLEFLIIFFMPHLTKYTGAKFFGKETSNFLRTVFWQVIEERMASGEKRHDLIDILIELKQKYGDQEEFEGFSK